MLRDALGIPVLVVSAVLLAAAGQAQEAETGAAATMGGSPPTGSVIFTQNLDEAPSDAGQLQQIYQQGLSGGWGGAYGYYVKQVGGSVLLAFNEGYVYDPASALKTLILAYATRQVSTGAEILTSPVTVYTYPHSRNAGGDPANKDLCPDLADEVPANASSSDLQSVLKGMMQASNNCYTRALELRYGRTALAAYASSLGMSSTRLNQIFGCGWDGDQRNEWTLTDAGRLYEAIDTGSAVPSSARASVLGPMLTTPIDYYGSVVQAEAATLGIADAVSEFVADVSGRQKGGSYNICIGSCASNTTVIRDEAGLLTLPVQSPKGVVPTDFVWGSFIVNERTSCSGFPCATAEQAGNAVRASLPELFRPAIHAALQTWMSVTELVPRRATYTPRGLVAVSARLATRYGGRHLVGMSVQFRVKRRVLCSALTRASGVAVCSGRVRKGASSYTATFSGSAGLFGTTAVGRIPKAPVPKKKK